jgi:hypothetical protein
MDLGGIINHTEQMIGGLKDLGHEVHLKEFVWANQAHATRKEGDFLVGPSGIPHHQGKGWNFGRHDRVAYRGGNLSSAIQILNGYDMVIWTVPVPSKNRDNMGNHDWPELYNLNKEVRQVAFIHDGNAAKGSMHLTAVQHHLDAIACVHPCALNGASIFAPRRALVVNPQQDPVRAVYAWDTKLPGFVNMQTFKAWKHVHELVEAIDYMPGITSEDELREVAGLGIEYRYMTSEDKCKDHYFHKDGRRFWDAALENGMTHHGYWDTDEVDMWLKQARVLVDPSWSVNYSKNGGHFNRVVVDAMIRGCVPVARPLGMGDELFKAGQHYVEIPHGVDAQQYADIILETGNMSTDRALDFRRENIRILQMFDRKIVAQRLIDLTLEGVDDQSTTHNPPNKKVLQRYENLMFEHFGVIV